MWIYLQYLEFVNAEDACKNTRPQRRLKNFSTVQFWNCPSKRQVDESVAKTLVQLMIHNNKKCNKLNTTETPGMDHVMFIIFSYLQAHSMHNTKVAMLSCIYRVKRGINENLF